MGGKKGKKKQTTGAATQPSQGQVPPAPTADDFPTLGVAAAATPPRASQRQQPRKGPTSRTPDDLPTTSPRDDPHPRQGPPVTPIKTATPPLTPSSPSSSKSGQMTPARRSSTVTPGSVEASPMKGIIQQTEAMALTPNQPLSATPQKPQIEINWKNRSGQGTFGNPFTSLEEKKQKHQGTKGRKIQVRANHFPMNVKCSTIFRYDIKFKPPWKRDIGKKDRPMLVRAVEEMKKKEGLDRYSIVFDGRSTILACKKLKRDKYETIVNIPEDLEPDSRMVEIKIKMEFVMGIPMKDAIEQFEQGLCGRDVQPLEPVQMLNIILTYAISIDPARFELIGNKYFVPSDKGRVHQIDAGQYVWHGTFESVRVGWKVRVNIDMANKPAYMKKDLNDFIGDYLHSKGKNCSNMEAMIYQLTQDRAAFDMASREVRDLKARFIRPDGAKRDYRMNGLVPGAKKLKFKPDNGQEMTVFDYFLQSYKYEIKYPDLPCVHVGDRKKRIYLPMECLELKQQVCPQSKILSDEATRNMIKVTAVRPDERQKRIAENLRELNQACQKNPFTKEFGISVQENFAQINARVLDAPVMAYDKGSTSKAMPREGKWQVPLKSTFVKPKPLKKWGVIDTARLFPDQRELFVKGLMESAKKMGMEVEQPEVVYCKDFQADDFFRKVAKNKDIVVVVTETKNDVYQKIKLIGDTEIKIPTQFVLKRNATGKGKGQPPSPMTMHNIVLKINSKLGGTNQSLSVPSRNELLLRNREPICGKPIMVVGADVTHPAPDQLGVKPSIAAIVASVDPAISCYICEVRVQFKQQNETHVTEQILDMENVFTNLLKRFRSITSFAPARIIFYRDGVSEGQFEMVLNKEIAAMQRACVKLNPNFQPPITYFVAQKRHHTRLFPADKKDALRNGNVLPGTVVDTDIIHPTVSSFFLASHEGIQGTTKPTYYVKLYDDNDLTADVEQALTYYLCHLYSRCERSVSYPAPTYNAHLAAFRARDHHNALMAKYGGSCGNIPPEEIRKVENLELPNYFV